MRPKTHVSANSLHDRLAACQFIQRIEPPGFDPDTLTDIQWRADCCTSGSLLCFQRFDDGRTDAEIVARYLADSRFGALLINRPLVCVERLHGRPIYVTAPGAWGATLERLCDYFYAVGPADWHCAGVTGTNGKTTTVKYLESILLAQGRQVLSIGTLGLALNGKPARDTGFTSPPYIELRRILAEFRDRADTLLMEISSHALHQQRAFGLRLEAAAWTNFSQDHLDYHGDETAYFDAKALLLEQLGNGVPLFTSSAEVMRRLQATRGDIPQVCLVPTPRLAADILRQRPFLALDFNRANYALAEAMASRLLGAVPTVPWRALRPVDGRFDCHVYGNRTIVIDFAHTPDALDNVLSAIRAAFPEARVITLFGCGGDRDRSKRPLMGAAVCRGSQHAIVTSDNPRFEDPRAIIDDVLPGMQDSGFAPEVVIERGAAIRRLFDWLAERPADESWVALIAGKGHERYIDRNGRKTYFSDQDQVVANLRRLGWVKDV